MKRPTISATGCRLVGWKNDPAIEPEAFDLIYRHSGGIPRRINTLCSRLLLYGALEGLHIIDAPAVQDVVADLRTEVTEAPSKPMAKVNGHAVNGSAQRSRGRETDGEPRAAYRHGQFPRPDAAAIAGNSAVDAGGGLRIHC